MSLGGQNTVIKHGTNGATTTLTAFTAKMRQAGLSLSAETVEATVFGDAYKDFEMSFKSGTISLSYKYDTTVWGQIAAIFGNGDTVDFEISPDGTTSGKPKVTGSMFITGFSLDMNIGELLEFPVEYQIAGAVTFGTH